MFKTEWRVEDYPINIRSHSVAEASQTSRAKLPRPGAKVPIQWAAQTRIDRHKELARDFTTRIFGLEWAWISDESSLGDFHDEETNETLTGKIRSVYGVDVSDIPNGNLADILDRIAETASRGA